MMNTLPELVLSTIFNYLRDSERILTLALVCKKWYNIVHSGASWKKVDFDCQRNVTPDILDKYVYAGTRKILLSEFCFLKWTDICGVLRRCKTIEVLIVPWIGYKKETVPDFTGMLNIEHLGFLELSHCKVTDSLFSQILVKCPMLKFLLIQDCQEITEQAYIAAGFKKHQNLQILNVAYTRNALSLRCVVELLKYSSGKVLLDIRGQKLAEVEFSEIIREHPDALERAFQDVDDYVHMLPI